MNWEYKVESALTPLNDSYLPMLNRLGAEGWELVAVSNDLAWFKRELPAEYSRCCSRSYEGLQCQLEKGHSGEHVKHVKYGGTRWV